MKNADEEYVSVRKYYDYNHEARVIERRILFRERFKIEVHKDFCFVSGLYGFLMVIAPAQIPWTARLWIMGIYLIFVCSTFKMLKG